MIGVLGLTSWVGAKASTNDETHSDLRSALSLASETDLFISQIESGRLLSRFQTAHADSLIDEARRQAKEARSSAEKRPDAKTFRLCAEQLEQLAGAVASIRTRPDSETLAGVRREVEAVRRTLIAAGAGR